MTTKTQQPEPPPKLRDAERSKRALLQAGTELFAEKGYSRARLRDIAGRAGVDAALVIRYFGSKHGLYQATLDNDDSSGLPLARRLTGNSLSELVDELVEHALTRWEDTGVGPLALSLSRPDAGTDIRAEVHQRVGDAILEPLSTAAAAARPARAAAACRDRRRHPRRHRHDPLAREPRGALRHRPRHAGAAAARRRGERVQAVAALHRVTVRRRTPGRRPSAGRPRRGRR